MMLVRTNRSAGVMLLRYFTGLINCAGGRHETAAFCRIDPARASGRSDGRRQAMVRRASVTEARHRGPILVKACSVLPTCWPVLATLAASIVYGLMNLIVGLIGGGFRILEPARSRMPTTSPEATARHQDGAVDRLLIIGRVFSEDSDQSRRDPLTSQFRRSAHGPRNRQAPRLQGVTDRHQQVRYVRPGATAAGRSF